MSWNLWTIAVCAAGTLFWTSGSKNSNFIKYPHDPLVSPDGRWAAIEVGHHHSETGEIYLYRRTGGLDWALHSPRELAAGSIPIGALVGWRDSDHLIISCRTSPYSSESGSPPEAYGPIENVTIELLR